MTESSLVLLREVVDRFLFIKVLMRCGEIAQVKYYFQSELFQIGSARIDLRIAG
jgi:hypothetical protein